MVDILLTFLISRMDDLMHPIPTQQHGLSHLLVTNNTKLIEDTSTVSASAQSRGQRSSTLLRIFKLIFNSINSFPENERVYERVLQPRLPTLVLLCLRLAHESRVSVNYCFVLRTLFRAVQNLPTGKFDRVYRDMIPLLPAILNGNQYNN
jgi:hypothetical protein